jgi:hypothetical protein
MNVKYKIKSGPALREAINDENAEQTLRCLFFCYQELFEKLDDEDKEWKGLDIEDTIETLQFYLIESDEDNINYYLEEFYDLCDDVGAWIEI